MNYGSVHTRLLTYRHGHLLSPQHFGLLLEQLHDIYLTNTRESILKTCAKTYKAMLSQEHAMRKEAEVAFGRLTDELADRLLQALPTLDPAVRQWA